MKIFLERTEEDLIKEIDTYMVVKNIRIIKKLELIGFVVHYTAYKLDDYLVYNEMKLHHILTDYDIKYSSVNWVIDLNDLYNKFFNHHSGKDVYKTIANKIKTIIEEEDLSNIIKKNGKTLKGFKI